MNQQELHLPDLCDWYEVTRHIYTVDQCRLALILASSRHPKDLSSYGGMLWYGSWLSGSIHHYPREGSTASDLLHLETGEEIGLCGSEFVLDSGRYVPWVQKRHLRSSAKGVSLHEMIRVRQAV